MSQNVHRDKTLALAALFQSAVLADALAWRGHCDPVAQEALLNSVLVLDTDEVSAIYGNNLRGLQAGLQALEQTFLEPLRGGHPRQADVVRYALSLIQVERHLSKAPELLDTLRRRLEMASEQRKHFDSIVSPAMLNNLGGIYVDTAGQLPFRIQVKGDPKHLKTTGTPEQVRAVLLAGVRAAWLWHRLGGRRWHLMFTRGQILGEIREIIRESQA
ncbi:MAG: high frequency lysogenization protein HflD [Moraxellaceae bacterium]|nr:high frequency lysogenization protein HflD [Moraxellaceae bacterium]